VRHFAQEAIVEVDLEAGSFLTLRSTPLDQAATPFRDLILRSPNETDVEVFVGNGPMISVLDLCTSREDRCRHQHQAATDYEFEVFYDVLNVQDGTPLPVPKNTREISRIDCYSMMVPSETDARAADASREFSILSRFNVEAFDSAGARANWTTTFELLKRVVGSDIMSLIIFMERLASISNRVCRIVVGRERAPRGTGFLVGPDLLMTAAHVFDDVEASSLGFIFNNIVLNGGLTSNQEISCGLAKEWEFDRGRPKGPPSPNDIDYVIVRLDQKIGDEVVKGTNSKRGFIGLPSNPTALDEGIVLNVVQYPAAEQISFASGRILKEDPEIRNRVFYTASTLDGSSGAPVFDDQLGLVALHVGAADDGQKANEGLPLFVINKAMKEHGVSVNP
jgi:V8-like Glu-specific endopeptidase